MRIRILSLAVLLSAVACAQAPRWENPSVPRDRWLADTASCERQAVRDSEREYAKQSRISGMDYTGQTPSHDQRMAAYEMQKFKARILEQCMAAKGYSKGKATR